MEFSNVQFVHLRILKRKMKLGISISAQKLAYAGEL